MKEIINLEAFDRCWEEVIPGFDDGTYWCISKDIVKNIWMFCEQTMCDKISELEKQIGTLEKELSFGRMYISLMAENDEAAKSYARAIEAIHKSKN